jgi:hypothetical protein
MTSNIPPIWHDEVLPSRWQDYAEAKRIPDDQIFRSWRRFKALSVYPWQYRRWTRWIDIERVRRREVIPGFK